jgi:hypothetical protein
MGRVGRDYRLADFLQFLRALLLPVRLGKHKSLGAAVNGSLNKHRILLTLIRSGGQVNYAV